VLVRPAPRQLEVMGIDARDWWSIAELGWDWLSGDWVAARAVTQTHARALRIAGHRRVLALFDGEPQMLDAGTEVIGGMSADRFLATGECA